MFLLCFCRVFIVFLFQFLWAVIHRTDTQIVGTLILNCNEKCGRYDAELDHTLTLAGNSFLQNNWNVRFMNSGDSIYTYIYTYTHKEVNNKILLTNPMEKGPSWTLDS
jgi:hypothetical protein